MKSELIGRKFGKLTVLNYAGSKNRRSSWECICDCGNITFVTTNHLTTHNTKSCGCLNHKPPKSSFATKHGKRNTRLYHIWVTMKQRCTNAKATSFNDYGGRGISICAEWLNDFQAFYDWAMAHGYADDLTLDRIDVNGNYCPENCRWATAKQQSNNKRSNHLITYNGKTKTIAEFAEEYGLNYITLNHRIKNGWNIEEALTREVQKCKN